MSEFLDLRLLVVLLVLHLREGLVDRLSCRDDSGSLPSSIRVDVGTGCPTHTVI